MSLTANATRFLEKAKTYLAENGDKVESTIDKVAHTVDTRTKGQHKTKIDRGTSKLKELVRSQAAKPVTGGTTAPPTHPEAEPYRPTP